MKYCSAIITLPLYTALLLFCSCNKTDSYETVLPVITEMVRAETDSSGDFRAITTDNKKRYLVSAGERARLSPDTVYRVICNYLVEDSVTASIISTFNILSGFAIPNSLLTGPVKKDPIKLISIWISGGYLNIAFQVMTFNKTHIITAIDYTERTKVKLGIYHDNQGDENVFTKEGYMSVPLSTYDFLKSGDSITFEIGRAHV